MYRLPCFSARKLDMGLENALDATITRTFDGRRSYPTPGLPSKMFERDFEPLGRGSCRTVWAGTMAFATACNSRYYDDMAIPAM